MRKKPEYANALDDMFSQDQKKRLSAVKLIRDIAASIGPVRVRNQLIGFLSQFLDDQVSIMLAVLEEITNFSQFLGGSEYDKHILPLLASFCKLDEKQVAVKALSIMQPILQKNPDENLEIIRKLSKTNMNVARQCSVKLIINAIKTCPHLEGTLLQIYCTLIFSDNASVRIIASKFLKSLTQKVRNQEQIVKIVQLIFNDSQDLVKLYCVDTLVYLYKFNSNLVMNKLKYLFSLNTWRINLKLCQMGTKFMQVISKSHFKVLIEPAYLKLLSTDDDQIRCAACLTLIPLTKNMNTEQINNKLLPILRRLSNDKIVYVKIQFANNLVKMTPFLNPQQIKDIIFPLIIELLKQNKLQLSYAILNNFQIITQFLSEDKQQQILIQPLKQQLQNGDWRIKSRIIQILGKIILKQKKISQTIIKFFFHFVQDKVQSVRLEAVRTIVNVIKNNCACECQCDILPEIIKIKVHPNYLIRQKVLMIIENTLDCANTKYLVDYKKIMIQYLNDRIPNIKLKGLKILKQNKKIYDKYIEKQIQKIKQDVDPDVQRAAKHFKN